MSKHIADDGGFEEFDTARQQPSTNNNNSNKRKARPTPIELKRQQRARKAIAAASATDTNTSSNTGELRRTNSSSKPQPSLFQQVISGVSSAPPIGPRIIGQNRYSTGRPGSALSNIGRATSLSAAVSSVPDFDTNRERVESNDAYLGTTLSGDAYANTMSDVFALRAQSSFGSAVTNGHLPTGERERTVALHAGAHLPVDFSLKQVVRVATLLANDGSFMQAQDEEGVEGNQTDQHPANTRETQPQRLAASRVRKLQGKLSASCNFSRAADVQRFSSGRALDLEESTMTNLKGDTLSWVYPTEPIPAAIARTLGKGVWPGDGVHTLFGTGGRRYVDGSEATSAEKNSTENNNNDNIINNNNKSRKIMHPSVLPATHPQPRAGPRMLFKRRCAWARSFMSAFHLVLTGRCPVLYYVEEAFTVVFLGPGVIGARDPTDLLPLSSDGATGSNDKENVRRGTRAKQHERRPVCAVLAPANKGLRRQLQRELVEFDTPLDPELRPDPNFDQTEEEDELKDELKRFEDDASRMNVNVGARLKRSTALDADDVATPCSFVGEAALRGLYTLLLNRVVKRGNTDGGVVPLLQSDNGIGAIGGGGVLGQVADGVGGFEVPLLISSAPFENAAVTYAVADLPATVSKTIKNSSNRQQQMSEDNNTMGFNTRAKLARSTSGISEIGGDGGRQGVQREWQLRLSGPLLGVSVDALANRMDSNVPGKWTLQMRATTHTAQVNVVLGVLRSKLAKQNKLWEETDEDTLPVTVENVNGSGIGRDVSVVGQ